MTVTSSYLQPVTPNHPAPNHPLSTFCTAVHIFITGEVRHFKFGRRIDHQVHKNLEVLACRRQTILERGVVRAMWPIVNFGATIISLEPLKLESSDYVHKLII